MLYSKLVLAVLVTMLISVGPSMSSEDLSGRFKRQDIEGYGAGSMSQDAGSEEGVGVGIEWQRRAIFKRQFKRPEEGGDASTAWRR